MNPFNWLWFSLWPYLWPLD